MRFLRPAYGIISPAAYAPAPSGGGGGGTAIWTQTDGEADSKSFASGPFDFSVDFGTEGGYPVFAIGWDYIMSPTAVTIGGHTATKLVETTAASKMQVWMVDTTTLTGTQTVHVTCGGTDVYGFIAGNIQTTTPTPSATNALASYTNHADPQTMDSSTTIPTDGVGVVFAVCEVSSDQSADWSSGGGTSDGHFLTALGNTIEVLGAHYNTAGAWTPGATGSTSPNGFNFLNFDLLVVAWGP